MARIWGPDTHAYLGKRFPDCTRCRLPQHEGDRIRWGCDAPSDRPVFEVGCGTCYGRDFACERCGGLGRIELYRCPTAVLSEAPPLERVQVDLLMRAYLAMDRRNVLPVDGGFIEQSRSYLQACEIIDAERARYEEMKEAKRERERQAEKARANAKRSRHGR